MECSMTGTKEEEPADKHNQKTGYDNRITISSNYSDNVT